VASFDPKSFSRNEWGILGGVLVAFIGLFFRAWHATLHIAGHSSSGGVTGWHFAGLWVPVLILAVPAAALVAVRALRNDLIPTLPVGTRLIVAGALILAVIIEVIRALTYPSAGFTGLGSSYSDGASFGTYIVTIATAIAVAFAVIDFKESGEALPKLPAKPAGRAPSETPPGSSEA
jgi:hypothetical protein